MLGIEFHLPLFFYAVGRCASIPPQPVIRNRLYIIGTFLPDLFSTGILFPSVLNLAVPVIKISFIRKAAANLFYQVSGFGLPYFAQFSFPKLSGFLYFQLLIILST